MSDSILVFGATGQVGRALVNELGERAVPLSRKQANLSDPESLILLLENLPNKPAAIINAAAYTAVDNAEKEEEVAHTINVDSVAILAYYAERSDIPFIHYSTDYVFSGIGHDQWKEEDYTAPLNAYGRTKLGGEKVIRDINGKYLILRTSWVYDSKGKNFFNTMVRLGFEREKLKVVNDQIGAPSYAPALAKATVEILDKALAMQPFPSGTYHMCNYGETSWYGFAEEIFRQARDAGHPLKITQLDPIPTSEYPTPATRPLNSRLDCTKLKQVFGIIMPDWEDSLAECIEEMEVNVSS